jgi:uncharacterized protein YceK
MKVYIAISSLAALFSCSGCGTAITHGGMHGTQYGRGVYLGTTYDCMFVGASFSGEDSDWGAATFGVLDIPFSLVADTIILPYDLFGYMTHTENSE